MFLVKIGDGGTEEPKEVQMEHQGVDEAYQGEVPVSFSFCIV